uniref:SecY-independent transporter protein n=1 Tax=Compsopogon caeruleus TaxID=31354 RepID=A0A1Z1XBK1_9RHOD|nr:SecY-independent transporter protein [Compsopogon caeruleus]ARX96187.1 SecY-independent transporter protein [Compsopogon caeruleus]
MVWTRVQIPLRVKFKIKTNMPFFFHKKEIFYRSLWMILSFFICWFFFYFNSETILIIVSSPILRINFYKRLIALSLQELFYIYWNVAFIFALIFWYPLFIYQISMFLKNAWYKYQLYDFILINCITWICYVGSFVIFLVYIMPSFCLIFIQNELSHFDSVLVLEIETQIQTYINWFFSLYFIFTITVLIFFFLLKIVLLLNHKITLFYLLRSRLIYIFIVVFLTLNIGVQDAYLILLCCCILSILYEMLVLLCCILY